METKRAPEAHRGALCLRKRGTSSNLQHYGSAESGWALQESAGTQAANRSFAAAAQGLGGESAAHAIRSLLPRAQRRARDGSVQAERAEGAREDGKGDGRGVEMGRGRWSSGAERPAVSCVTSDAQERAPYISERPGRLTRQRSTVRRNRTSPQRPQAAAAKSAPGFSPAARGGQVRTRLFSADLSALPSMRVPLVLAALLVAVALAGKKAPPTPVWPSQARPRSLPSLLVFHSRDLLPQPRGCPSPLARELSLTDRRAVLHLRHLQHPLLQHLAADRALL